MQATERLVNLIAFLLDANLPATADDIRHRVAGYDPDQSDEAFQRMFERDKEDLRELGVPLRVEETDDGEAAYVIDHAAYYLPPIDLNAEEALALRLSATLLASDPGYPFGEEIGSVLAKLACECEASTGDLSEFTVRLAPEAVAAGERVNLGELRRAITRRKTATFDYHSLSSNASSTRTVEPYGLINSDGHWYLVAFCRRANAVRTFRLSRIVGSVHVNLEHPKRADFEMPPDLDLSTYLRKPWQVGEQDLEVAIRFAPHLASWARRVLRSAQSWEEADDGSLITRLSCADEQRFVRWVLSLGPGAVILEPASVRELAAAQLHATLAAYEEVRQ